MPTTSLRLKMLHVTIAVLALVTFAACSSKTPSGSSKTPSTPGPTSQSPSPTPTASDTDTLTGTWAGTYESTSAPGSGTFTIQWTQSGQQLSGTIDIKNSACITTGTISGALSGGKITFGAVKGGTTIAYTGSVSGDTMSGTYSAPDCDNGKGTWTATKTA